MPCRLITVVQFQVIQYAILHHVYSGLIKKISQAVEFLLRNHPVYKYDGVAKVTTFDQVIGKEIFQFMKKNKRPGIGDLFFEVFNILQDSILGSQHPGLEVDHYRHLECIIGDGNEFHFVLLIPEDDILSDLYVFMVPL